MSCREILLAARSKVITKIQRLQSRHKGSIVVTLDGRSGAGKSTLASLIQNEVDTALIPLDDFFTADIPDRQWDQFTVEEKLKHVFDWKRLRDYAIEPLLKGSLPGVMRFILNQSARMELMKCKWISVSETLQMSS
jgi:chloramphenicol 3-O-phosphotransferase